MKLWAVKETIACTGAKRVVVAMLPSLLLQRSDKARARLAGLLVEILQSQIDGVDRVVVVILQLVDSGL